MDFPMVDEKEGRYAHVFPVGSDGNESLRKVANDLGDPKMVGWRGKGEEARWRLFESRIPQGVDPEQAFSKFLTPEAEKGFMSERAQRLESAKTVERVMPKSEEIPADKLYYPVTGKERDAFNAKIAEHKEAGNPVDMLYNPKVGAYVHRSGPTEGFERWQTPEAKAEWDARGRVRENAQERTASRAAEVADQGGVADLRGKGLHFQAEHINGFKLPSPAKYPDEHKAMMEGMKKAPNEELEAVFKTTEAGMRALERKLYAVQLSAAEKKGVDKAAFDKMDSKGRREASGYADISREEFANLVSLKNGFFKLNAERNERGMYKTVEQARDLKEGSSVSTPGGSPKGADEQEKALKQDAPAQTGGRAKSRGAAAAAALAHDLGR